MSWLLKSSIVRKLIMSISGLFLVLFLMFHSLMNFVVILSADAYNTIASLLGANWYALIATGILALGFIVHIIYASILTLQNQKARGSNKYAVSQPQKNVSWASKNMFVLGTIILGFLVLHLIHFWSKMQLVELMHGHNYAAAGYHDPTDGAYFIRELFTQPLYSIIYIVWLVALWYHLTHGFWSAMQTLGWGNQISLLRLKKKPYAVATIISLMSLSIGDYSTPESGV